MMEKVMEFHGYRIRTGVFGDGPYSPILLETASAGLRLSAKLFEKIKALAEDRPLDRRRDRLVSTYGGVIGAVYDSLTVEELKQSTVERYTRLMGEFLTWCEEHAGKRFTTQDVANFLEFLARRSRERAQKRFGAPSEMTSLAVVRLAYYALKRILDDLFEMDLVGDLPAPPRPKPTTPAAPETVETLYSKADDEADELILLLTNGLDLRVGKAAQLNWNHFDRQCGKVMVQHGESTRNVPIQAGLQSRLRQLRPRPDADTPLFPSRRKPDRSAVGIRALQYRLARLASTSGIVEHVTLTALCKARTIMAA